MKIFEVINPKAPQLAALAQLLKGRIEDTASEGSISVDAFVKLARGIGLSIDRESLSDLIAEPPLSNLIDSVRGNEVHFAGVNNDVEPTSSDEADDEDVVKQMAKRQLAKGK